MRTFQSGSWVRWQPCDTVRPTFTSLSSCPITCSMSLWFSNNFGCSFFLVFRVQLQLHWHLLQRLIVLLHSMRTFQSGTRLRWRPWEAVRPTSTSLFSCSIACSMSLWFSNNLGFLFFLFRVQLQLHWPILLQRFLLLLSSMRTFQSGSLLRWRQCGTVRSTSTPLPSCSIAHELVVL